MDCLLIEELYQIQEKLENRVDKPIGGGLPGQYSKKYCCCGGHSSKDPTKNLNNHSTKIRLDYRLARIDSKKLVDILLK